MSRGLRLAAWAIAFYLAALGFVWFWFHPLFVSMRVRERVSIGAPAADIEKEFETRPYDFPQSAYCGTDGPPDIRRIAVDEASRVPLLPLPVAMVTTTIFCFDANDKLVGTKTERWFDGL